MRASSSAAILLLMAAGCHSGADREQAASPDHAVRIAAAGEGAGRVAISIPGVGGKLTLPGMDLSRHVDLDGIALAPGTAVHDIDVVAHDRPGGADDGQVRIGFSSPRAPGALVGWYREQAARAGYAAIAAAGGDLTATKGGKRFSLTVAPKGGGSAGTITMGGAG